MTTLRDLKRQIRSIGNIKKITDAMERVAAARLKKAQKKAEGSRPYIQRMKKTVESLLGSVKNPLFLERKEKKKTALIIISSDRGLTGPYNTNVFSKSAHALGDFTKGQIELILFGKKAIEHYGTKGWDIRGSYKEWGGKFTFEQATELSHSLIDSFIKGEVDQVWLIYTRYITVMRREVRKELFLPIMKPDEAEKANKTEKSSKDKIFEPNEEEIVEALLPRYCASRLFQFLQESYASELASRIVAMQSASKNSEELTETLTRRHNKMRQGQITKEMIEITAGAEAKG